MGGGVSFWSHRPADWGITGCVGLTGGLQVIPKVCVESRFHPRKPDWQKGL